MKKIILAGASLNSGNKGVNALTRGQSMLILDKYGQDTEITILSYTVKEIIENKINHNDKEIVIKEIPCRFRYLIEAYVRSLTIGKNYITEYIKSSDAVWDISEGDSFSDIYGGKRFIQHSLIKMTALNLKTKLVIMPQTLGPFKRRWVKNIASRILNKSNVVFVRDEISKEIANKDLKVKREIKYVPDMAFYMKPDTRINIEKFVSSRDSIKVGINVSALLYNGGYNGKNMFGLKANYKILVDSLIEKFAQMNNVEIILIPHVITNEMEVEDDFRVCSKIAKNINEKIDINIRTLDKAYREDELKSVISGCDFFIGSRMHACIGAISTNVPTAPIAYSRKFIGIWDKLSLGNCVTDPRNQSEEEIIESILNTFNNRESVKNILIEKIPMLKTKIEEIIPIIEGK